MACPAGAASSNAAMGQSTLIVDEDQLASGTSFPNTFDAFQLQIEKHV